MLNAGTLIQGVKAAIGATALQLTTDATPLNNGVRVKSIVGNGAIVYVGLVGVTTSTGYPLSAGESELFAVRDASKLFVIATTSEAVRYQGS